MFKELINENKDWGGLTWAKLMEGGPERGERVQEGAPT